MKVIDIKTFSIPDVHQVFYKRFEDERGYFTETYNFKEINALTGFGDFIPIQINESFSYKNVLRGLHIQYNPPQRKIIRALSGNLLDLALDLRPKSPSYKKIACIELDSQNPSLICLPQGVAHGVIFPNGSARIEYVCDNIWNPEGEASVSFWDKGIDWAEINNSKEIKNLIYNPLLNSSPRDQAAISIAEYEKLTS